MSPTDLADLSNDDILTLGMKADEARRAGATASRVLYQRVCVLQASDVGDGLSVPDAASEVRLMTTPDAFEEALSLIRAVKEAAGPRPVSACSLADVAERSRAGWGDLRDVLTQLAGAGMTDVAELPVDLLENLSASVTIARAAGLLAQRLTLANAAGDRKLEVLNRIRDFIREVGGVRRVAPLPRHVRQDKPTTGYEDVRMVALARLALHAPASSQPVCIEVDWSLYGPKLAQVALTFGADFLDAVPATSDESLGRRRGTVEEVERNIRAAGFEPQEYRP